LQRICQLRRHGFYNEMLWEAHDEITRLQRALMDAQLVALHAATKQPCDGFGAGCQGMDCPKCEGAGVVLPNAELTWTRNGSGRTTG
jgi:hypothetical protein